VNFDGTTFRIRERSALDAGRLPDDDPGTLVPTGVPTGFPFANFTAVFSLPETGDMQDLSHFFPTVPVGYVQVQSDVEPTPEPATILLVGSSLLLLGLSLSTSRIRK